MRYVREGPAWDGLGRVSLEVVRGALFLGGYCDAPGDVGEDEAHRLVLAFGDRPVFRGLVEESSDRYMRLTVDKLLKDFRR